ncbi:MAG: hypothetical protein M5U28_30405 [Sandaracinaceae bacterium]|nr:hypothetical protein [Sandaracinaceae bacterium]
MYREEAEIDPRSERADVEEIADALRERALVLARRLRVAGSALSVVLALPPAALVMLVAETHKRALATITGLLVLACAFGLARWLGRRILLGRVRTWVAQAEQRERVDGADVWRRIWAGFY